MFGGDLRDVTMPASGGSVPSSWFDYNACVEVLREHGINPNRIDTLEVYAGCANWTEACRRVGLKVGAPIDNKHHRNRWNLLSAKWRRVLWAVVVVCQPRWIHSGFPCTFWVRLAHLTQEDAAAKRSRSFARVGASCSDTPAGQVAASERLYEVVGKSARRSVLEPGHHAENFHGHKHEESIFRLVRMGPSRSWQRQALFEASVHCCLCVCELVPIGATLLVRSRSWRT